jgi:hypothetical protein
VEVEMDFVIVSKLPAIKAFISKEVTHSHETIPVFILSFSGIYGWTDINVCMYVFTGSFDVVSISDNTAAIREQ